LFLFTKDSGADAVLSCAGSIRTGDAGSVATAKAGTIGDRLHIGT
jgi:hypothetical protein